MNIKEYIESGIVATYVLGLATETEQKEFEYLCNQHLEVAEAKRLFEVALEEQLMKEAIPVPAGLKQKVLASFNNPDLGYVPGPEKENKPRLLKVNIWKMVAAACLLLLAASIFFTYSVTKQYQKLLITANQTKNNSIRSDNNNPFKAIDTLVQKPSVKWSTMLEPKDSSHCLAHIYWDTLSLKTFLLVGNIPTPVSNKQFQLWALQGNRAVDLGIFDAKNQGQVVTMKNVQKAEKFVITIEQHGGSITPTMDAMYAIGKP